MPACPSGHESDEAEWCDVCGLALDPPRRAPRTAPAPACAVCGAPLSGRFCERCGHDSTAPARPAPPRHAVTSRPSAASPVTWRAVVRADRAWFDEVRGRGGVDAATLPFPQYASERRFELSGPQVAIGRRNPARGIAADLDLAGFDPGVSAAHAVLVARPDGGWDLVDVGSTNGTTLTVEDGPVPAHRPVPLADGAVIRLGAWTTITLTAASPAP